MTLNKKILTALLTSLALAIYLWCASDSPPYGNPGNELSNVYWPLIVDIARKWRSMDFSFWDRGVGGGMSLFTVGSYPILNPTNALAWILDNDRFYLFKIIEPFVIGCFLMMLLLLNVFRVRFSYAVIGTLLYLGIIWGRHMTLAITPIMIWGVALFPAMVYAFARLSEYNLRLACAAVGALIALLFAAGGIAQILQMLVWWVVFLSLYFIFCVQKPRLQDWCLSIATLLFMAFGVSAVQFLPTLHFVLFESGRSSGSYLINSLPLFNMGPSYDMSFAEYTRHAFLISDAPSTKGQLVLMCIALAIWIANFKKVIKDQLHKRLLFLVWGTTAFYVVLPTAMEQLVSIVPALKGVFGIFNKISFLYGIFTLDFCVSLSLCIVLSDVSLTWVKPKLHLLKKALVSGLLVFAFLKAGIYTAMATVLFYFRKKNKVVEMVFIVFCLILGLKSILTSYVWNDKGQQIPSATAEFGIKTPEYTYYRQSAGKYFLPYDYDTTMGDNYNLLYALQGTSGFLPVPPKRFGYFVNHYPPPKQQEGVPRRFMITYPSDALADYLPVDFTMTKRDHVLPWTGFTRLIQGQNFDIWARDKPLKHVHFALELFCVPFQDVVKYIHEGLNNKIFIESKDAIDFDLKDTQLFGKASSAGVYWDFKQKGHYTTFQVHALKDTFISVTDMFQKGWEGWVDGKKIPLFPANYLFLGAFLPQGIHQVELRFTPPWFWLGVCFNLLAIIVLAGMFLNTRKPLR